MMLRKAALVHSKTRQRVSLYGYVQLLSDGIYHIDFVLGHSDGPRFVVYCWPICSRWTICFSNQFFYDINAISERFSGKTRNTRPNPGVVRGCSATKRVRLEGRGTSIWLWFLLAQSSPAVLPGDGSGHCPEAWIGQTEANRTQPSRVGLAVLARTTASENETLPCYLLHVNF
jgi:hypothetical protein